MAAAFRAACIGDLDTVKSCLEGVDAMDINEVDEGVPYATGFTLLLCAMGGNTPQGREEGHLDVARYLLSTGVRAAGSFKLYCRIEHKTILRLRSLAARKRATTKNALLARIVRLPNGPCWKVLSYWRATE